MDSENQELERDFGSFFWVIGIVALVCPLVLVLDWLDVGFLDGQGPTSVVALLAVGMIGLTIQGLRTGKLVLRVGYVERHKNPVGFWICLTMYVLVSGFLIAGFFLSLRS